MVQGYGLQEEDYRGRRFALAGAASRAQRPARATRRDVVREIHETTCGRGPTSHRNRLRSTPTPCRWPTTGFEEVRLRDFEGRSRNRAARPTGVHGPQPAESRVSWRDRWVPRTDYRCVGRRTESRPARWTFAQLVEAYTDQGAGTGGRRGGHPAGWGRFRHAQRQGGPLGHRHALRAAGRAIPVMVSGNARRRQRPHLSGQTVGGFAVSVVAREPAVGRAELRLRGQAAAALNGWRQWRERASRRTRTQGFPT